MAHVPHPHCPSSALTALTPLCHRDTAALPSLTAPPAVPCTWPQLLLAPTHSHATAPRPGCVGLDSVSQHLPVTSQASCPTSPHEPVSQGPSSAPTAPGVGTAPPAQPHSPGPLPSQNLWTRVRAQSPSPRWGLALVRGQNPAAPSPPSSGGMGRVFAPRCKAAEKAAHISCSPPAQPCPAPCPSLSLPSLQSPGLLGAAIQTLGSSHHGVSHRSYLLQLPLSLH